MIRGPGAPAAGAPAAAGGTRRGAAPATGALPAPPVTGPAVGRGHATQPRPEPPPLRIIRWSAGPKNQFSAVAGGAYDPIVVTGIPAWREVQLLVTRELGEPVSGAGPLVPARRSGMTWAARAQRAGAIVVKVRHGDRAYEKTQWCAAHLPALGARGYPVPAI